MASLPKRVISRETLLGIRRRLTDADYNSWRGLRHSTATSSTPAVKKKGRQGEGGSRSAETPQAAAGAARSQSSQPKTIWERQKEERERSRQQAAEKLLAAQNQPTSEAAAESFRSTFSEADRLRLAQLREQLRSRTLPPPNVRQAAAPSSAFAPPAGDDHRIFGGPVAAGTAAPKAVAVKKKGTRAAEEEIVSQESTPTTAAGQQSVRRTPATEPHRAEPAGPSPQTVRKSGWARMPELPQVSLQEALSSQSSGLNPAAKEFRPQGSSAGCPEESTVVPLAPPEPVLARLNRGALKSQSAVRRLTNATSSTTVDGRRVPQSKEFLLAMHPDYVAFYQAYNPLSYQPPLGPGAFGYGESSTQEVAAPAMGTGASVEGENGTTGPQAPLESATDAQVATDAPPQDDPSAGSGADDPAADVNGECLPYGYSDWSAYYSTYFHGYGYWTAPSQPQPPEVSAAREEERLARFEQKREELSKLLTDANAAIEGGVREAIAAELAAQDSALNLMDELTKEQFIREYRRERLRTERLSLVYRLSREHDVSAKGLASLLLAILMDRSKACASDREAKYERRKAKWVAKMLETASESQVNKRLAQRRRQLEIGMSTVGYAVYERVKERKDPRFDVPKQVRMPIPEQLCSKRGWDGLIRQWRQRLHQYDKFAEQILSPEEIKQLREAAQRAAAEATKAEDGDEGSSDDGDDDDDDAKPSTVKAT